MNRAHLVAPIALSLLAGCGPKVPPPGWQQGGAPLYLPRATWSLGYASVELMPDGRVFQNGNPAFGIDRAGRVYDLDGSPVAMLRPDGRLIGTGNEDLGTVGPVTASPPGAKFATMTIAPSGQVIRYDDSGGDPGSAGSWAGCGQWAPALQACMLVTFLTSTKYPPPNPVNRYYPSTYGTPIMPGFGLGFP